MWPGLLLYPASSTLMIFPLYTMVSAYPFWATSGGSVCARRNCCPETSIARVKTEKVHRAFITFFSYTLHKFDLPITFRRLPSSTLGVRALAGKHSERPHFRSAYGRWHRTHPVA